MIEHVLTWSAILQLMSWIYSIAWTLSFYGQICQNHRLKNVEGMNFSFAAINLNGFLLYALYNTYGYFIDQSQTGLVGLADLFFSLHALAATLYTAIQACRYPAGINKLSNNTKWLIAGQWLFLVGYIVCIKLSWVEPNNNWGVISCIGYLKLMCSCLKYLPQLFWNCQRQSTHGWSIFNVLMDLTGGIFSVSEILFRYLFFPDFSVNIVKLLLGTLTIAYDLVFVYQHYVLYPSSVIRSEKALQESPSDMQIQNKSDSLSI